MERLKAFIKDNGKLTPGLLTTTVAMQATFLFCCLQEASCAIAGRPFHLYKPVKCQMLSACLHLPVRICGYAF